VDDRRLTLVASLRPAALDARRGVVRLHPEVLAALGARPWDPLRLTGRRATGALAALTDPATPRGLLLCDDLTLGNLAVRDGTAVQVEPVAAVPARRLEVSGPREIEAVVGPESLRTALLGKAVTGGDDVSLLPQDFALPDGADPAVQADAARRLRNAVGFAWTTVLLHVTGCDPAGPAIVTMDTTVGWRHGSTTVPAPGRAGTGPGSPPAEEPAPRLDDLPGLHAEAQALREWLDLGFHHTDLLSRLGTRPTLGILVTGPAGSGKTTLVRAVAADLGASVVRLAAPDVAALEPNAAAARLREALAEAERQAPAVLVVQDVEAVAAREQDTPVETVLFEVVRRVTSSDRVAVVCTSSRPEEVDPRLRRPGMLEREVRVPLPDRAQRRAVLGVLTRSMPLAPDVHLDDVAGRTPGFVAADLLALVREAGVRAAVRQKDADTPTVAGEDVAAALEVVRPTSMAESTLEISDVALDEVGDMAEVKQALTEAVLWPLSYPDTFARLGVRPPRGVLLYGPPGCGKTFLVKAVAGTGQANVLSVKGAELLTKWVGESERAVRDLFRRAREAAPTLVFLDEVDALAPVRGQSNDGGTTDRVVAALLTELDGVEDLRDVVVIGATNRPDLVDPALRRPGRMERLVYVPPPDGEARAAILEAAARGVPLAPDVDLAALGRELDGFSAADCAALVREAALTAMRESMDTSTVTAAHVAAARARVHASLDPVQVAQLAAFADRYAAR